MLVLIQRLRDRSHPASISLALTAEERTRSRYRFQLPEGDFLLHLPRGTVLRNGDRLLAETGEIVQIIAKPESVLTITASTTLALLQAAYHLGNRHVPLEIAPSYLRLLPDPVLETMLAGFAVEIALETAPFQPESGAYGHSHG